MKKRNNILGQENKACPLFDTLKMFKNRNYDSKFISN